MCDVYHKNIVFSGPDGKLAAVGHTTCQDDNECLQGTEAKQVRLHGTECLLKDLSPHKGT